MRVEFKRAARMDAAKQFNYYLKRASPATAVRFQRQVEATAATLRQNPLVAQLYPASDPTLSGLRSWPVMGFEVIRLYFRVVGDTMLIVRVLHSKRNVRAILKYEAKREGR